MNTTKQYLEVGQKVTFVGGDSKTHQGTITQIYNDNTARIEWENGSAIAVQSDKNEPGTFHFEQASPKVEHKK